MLVQVIYCNYLPSLLHLEVTFIKQQKEFTSNSTSTKTSLLWVSGSRGQPPSLLANLLCLRCHTPRLLQLRSLSMKQTWSGAAGPGFPCDPAILASTTQWAVKPTSGTTALFKKNCNSGWVTQIHFTPILVSLTRELNRWRKGENVFKKQTEVS